MSRACPRIYGTIKTLQIKFCFKSWHFTWSKRISETQTLHHTENNRPIEIRGVTSIGLDQYVDQLNGRSVYKVLFILKLLLRFLQFRCGLFSIKWSFQQLISLSLSLSVAPPFSGKCNWWHYKCVMKLHSYSGRLLKHSTIVQRNYIKFLNISVEQVLP